MKITPIGLSANSTDSLQLVHLVKETKGPPVLCIHGAFDSGRIFYNQKGTRGLASYLAHNHCEVYVGDLRGHGGSLPPVDSSSRYGMHENIAEDIPLFLKTVIDRHPQQKIRLIAHSDGGVLLVSALARNPELLKHIHSVTLLGAKRAIKVKSLRKWFAIDLVWYRLVPLIVKVYGYFPAKSLKIGSQNDTRGFTQQRMKWLKGKPWIDPVDGTNYLQQWRQAQANHPIKFHYWAAPKDPYLGHPKDVRLFCTEVGHNPEEVVVLSQKNGYSKNYNHVSMMTDKACEKDHFPSILTFLQ